MRELQNSNMKHDRYIKWNLVGSFLKSQIIYSALFPCFPSLPHGAGNANIQHEVWANSSHSNTEEYLKEILHIMHVYCVGITACYSYSFEIVISKVVLVCFVHYFAFLSVTCINM